MKKKIALLLVMIVSLFSMISGFNTLIVSADDNGFETVDPPTPRP